MKASTPRTSPSTEFSLRPELSSTRSATIPASVRSDSEAGNGPGINEEGAAAESREQRAQSEAARRIQVSLAFMMEHLHQPLQVATLSAQAGVSASHFYSLFKRATGLAPIDYLIRARMARACRLLTETTLKVKEIAALLGYHDQYYFSRQFRAVNHIPPSRYRLQAAGTTAPTPTAVVGKTPAKSFPLCQSSAGSPTLNPCVSR